MEKKIKEKFKQLDLGFPIYIIKGIRWAKGDTWIVKTFSKKYTVVEENGEVRSIKDLNRYYYQKEKENEDQVY